MLQNDLPENKKSVASPINLARGGKHALKNESAGYAIYHRTSEQFKNK
ncbi:MAG: hypothetical protein M0Z55_07865 [Peptococcaceae bacterium]|nr:hypothetical protein [Peptococcaceae bacterium]